MDELGMLDDFAAPREEKVYGVAEFLERCNGMLAEEFWQVVIEGEVGSFKINQGRWVFFDLKEDNKSVGCFMVRSQLRMAVEDGMRIRVVATPKVTDWGKFSLTVRSVKLVGEGDLKRSFEMMRARLAKEGLFDVAKKRPLPEQIAKIGVISSMQAAGYADFVKILNARWGGMEVRVAHTLVQGEQAAGQMIRALRYFNEVEAVDLIVMVRGGGSADDLACFNDEELVRAIAGSRTVVVTGIGHEIDTSLADLAADVVGSTPSNVAELITRDRVAERAMIAEQMARVRRVIWGEMERRGGEVREMMGRIKIMMVGGLDKEIAQLAEVRRVGERVRYEIDARLAEVRGWAEVLAEWNPEKVLEKGYAIMRGAGDVGSVVKITTKDRILTAEVKNVEKR